MVKVNQQLKLGHHTREFLWLGSQWTCKKRRKHYKAFRRNGVKISVRSGYADNIPELFFRLNLVALRAS